MFQFHENKGMKIDVTATDNPLFFFNLFMTNQLLNELVTRSNAYAKKVLSSSRTPEKEKCFKHLKIYNCHRHEAVSRISFTYGACFHANIQVLLVSGSIVSKLFKSVMTRDRFTSVMQFLNFGVEPVNEDDRLGKIRFLINHLNTIFVKISTPH